MARARWTTLLCGLALSLPALAWQQSGMTPMAAPQTGSTMATGQTGAMPMESPAKKVEEAGKAFDAMDEDHDGRVSESEMNRSTNGYPPRDAPTSAQTIQAADIDGDRKLTRDEVQAKAAKDAMANDANQAGQAGQAAPAQSDMSGATQR